MTKVAGWRKRKSGRLIILAPIGVTIADQALTDYRRAGWVEDYRLDDFAICVAVIGNGTALNRGTTFKTDGSLLQQFKRQLVGLEILDNAHYAL